MAGNYQNVGTPRFWVSSLQWLDSLGMIVANANDTQLSGKNYKKLPYINPTEATNFQSSSAANTGDFAINFDIIETFLVGENPVNWSDIMPNDNSFFMLLGHNFTKSNGNNGIAFYTADSGVQQLAGGNYLNYSSTENKRADYQGFSIGTANDAHSNDYNRIRLYFSTYTIANDKLFSSFLYGTFFNLQAPDLNLTLTREYGEVKTLQSKTGYTYSNSFITKQPNWGNGLPAWHLALDNDINQDGSLVFGEFSINGRRVWDLKFSYLDEQNIFSKVSSVTDYITGSSDNIAFLGGALLQENTFYSQVLLRTQGLPFVFQPDSNNSNPDQFAICMFDQNSFQFKRTSLNTYDVSLKIREVW